MTCCYGYEMECLNWQHYSVGFAGEAYHGIQRVSVKATDTRGQSFVNCEHGSGI